MCVYQSVIVPLPWDWFTLSVRPALYIYSHIYRVSIRYWIWNPEIKRQSSVLKRYITQASRGDTTTKSSWQQGRAEFGGYGWTPKALLGLGPAVATPCGVGMWSKMWRMWPGFPETEPQGRVVVEECSGIRNDAHNGRGMKRVRGVPVGYGCSSGWRREHQ